MPFEKVPGPPTLPLLGTLHHFLPKGKKIIYIKLFHNVKCYIILGRYEGLDLVDLCLKLYEDYGDIVNLKGMPGKRDLLFLYDLNDFEKVSV